ncbi:MAG: aspartate carbamoyltransferase catalytic subunit [Bacteriovoracaceae bacterium]|nr:aspartate carbamoyltransferase catalytic subunit [Bacteriovoracaceae bacterium]
MSRDLLSISHLNLSDIENIFSRASFFLQSKTVPPILENQTVTNLFFEMSTRTRFSFELAAKKLGANVLNFAADFSSMGKGETLYDTLKVLESMGVNAVVIRHKKENIWNDLIGKTKLSLINAGTGTKDHPSQGLLDAFTLKQYFGKLENLTVAIVGDVLHSRVAHSNIECLGKLGVQVLLSGPEYFLDHKEKLPSHVRIVSMAEATESADALMLLRIQKERHETNGNFENYLESFGLDEKRLQKMKPHAVIMHPGPFNRGVEIAENLVESPRSLIFKQVQNGVYVRMAILEWALS